MKATSPRSGEPERASFPGPCNVSVEAVRFCLPTVPLSLNLTFRAADISGLMRVRPFIGPPKRHLANLPHPFAPLRRGVFSSTSWNFMRGPWLPVRLRDGPSWGLGWGGPSNSADGPPLSLPIGPSDFEEVVAARGVHAAIFLSHSR